MTFTKVTLITDKDKFHSLLRNLRKQIKAWEKAADGPSMDAEHEAAFTVSELASELLNLLASRKEEN